MSSSLQTLIRDLHRRRGRERRGLALAEGVRLVEEALASGVTVRGAAASPALESTTRGKALKATLLTHGVQVEDLTDAELEGLAVLDGVQDPGNVGTMLRTALGLGAAGLVALKGTADLTNPKVIRGAMGASFRLPAVTAAPDEFVAWVRLQRAQIWVADAAGETGDRLLARRGDRPAVALVVGNEGAGVGPSVDAAADRRIAVPLAPGVESLNVAVAAGILLYEVTRVS